MNKTARPFLSRPPMRWFESLLFRFFLPQFFLLLVLLGITIAVTVTAADAATQETLFYIIALELLVFLLLFFIVRDVFIQPIRQMAMQVKRFSESKEMLEEKLDESRRHEMGELAHQFNRRTEQLSIALDRIDRSKDILEQLVKIRTSELERANISFQNILNSASDGIISIDKEQKIILFNQQAQEIFGYRPEEVLGRPFEILLPDRFRGEHQEFTKAFMTQKGDCRTTPDRPDLFGLRKNGQEFPAVITFSKVEVEGKAIGTAIVRDVTEKKRLEEIVLHSEKMSAIGQLAGGVAHDFNNLLTVILGHTTLLQMSPLAPDVSMSIREIQDSATRAAALTRQLLAYSRKQILQLKVTDINEIVRKVDKMVRRLIGENIELVILLGEGLPMVNVDPSQIEQAIVNLTVNARDSISGGGKIVVETSACHMSAGGGLRRHSLPPGDYVRLAVSDTGSGMSEEVKKHLFEPFFTTKEKGTGLGLATVHGIIKQMEGFIDADSEAGKGAVFTIYLPSSKVPRGGGTAVRTEPVEGALPTGHETLLVVEDEELVRSLAINTLRRQGFRVIEARNGQEAVEACQQHEGEPIDLLVTDMVMPYMGGGELAEKFSVARPGVVMVFTSGYSDHSAVQKWLDKGHLFLQKPYMPAELLRVIRMGLDVTARSRGKKG